MQRPAVTTPGTQTAAPFFSTNIWGPKDKSSADNNNNNANNANANANANDSNGSYFNISTLSPLQSVRSSSRSRPGTSSGDRETTQPQPREHSSRRPSFSRKASFPSALRRGSSSGTNGSVPTIVTDAATPPALPDYAVAAATAAKLAKEADTQPSPASVDSFSKMMGRTAATPTNGFYNTVAQTTTSPPLLQTGLPLPPTESPSLHQHIHDLANKRISTLDYLRKAHEGRVYWFNTLLFDKPDLARMPYFDSRKLARRATNYLLLGLSLPAVVDLNSSTPLEFLRSLNTLLNEFDSYQAIHTENGVNSSSLSRARLPQMFRRGRDGKGRRQSGATGSIAEGATSSFYMPTSTSSPSGDGGMGLLGSGLGDGSAVNSAPAGVINFGLGGEGNDLLPGEEYTHLLTPNLPFDPDFFETFATLCDVLIDCYARLMALLPTPRDCSPTIAELFTKADVRVRKIIIQGVVKEFEDTSRLGLKQEIASVGKVVLGGLV
ncbi:hypothetical protein F4780DRAFT_501439 [Xylariomycetidae sp. FL0641]|nr:hypothetical protein F4780DRAFT_501439 [Xylariomycetidae sp. FL0641]